MLLYAVHAYICIYIYIYSRSWYVLRWLVWDAQAIDDVFYFYFQFYRAKPTRQWPWTLRLIKIKGQSLKNGIFSLPCQNVWTIFVPHDFIFCSFLRLNRSQRCFDSICPIERWPKSGSRSSGSTEFCSNFEMSRQEFTILQDVLCTEMLSHICVVFHLTRCWAFEFVRGPLPTKKLVMQVQSDSWGRESNKNFLLSEWHGWWGKSGFWKSLKVIIRSNYVACLKV